MRMDEMKFTLHNPLTKEEWDIIEDVDFEHTSSITFHTKHGKNVEFVKRKTGKWIPCDERLPEDDGWYQVSYESTFPASPFIRGTELDLSGQMLMCFKKFENGKWKGGVFEGMYDPVIAWNSEKIEYINEPYKPDISRYMNAPGGEDDENGLGL